MGVMQQDFWRKALHQALKSPMAFGVHAMWFNSFLVWNALCLPDGLISSALGVKCLCLTWPRITTATRKEIGVSQLKDTLAIYRFNSPNFVFNKMLNSIRQCYFYIPPRSKLHLKRVSRTFWVYYFSVQPATWNVSAVDQPDTIFSVLKELEEAKPEAPNRCESTQNLQKFRVNHLRWLSIHFASPLYFPHHCIWTCRRPIVQWFLKNRCRGQARANAIRSSRYLFVLQEANPGGGWSRRAGSSGQRCA